MAKQLAASSQHLPRQRSANWPILFRHYGCQAQLWMPVRERRNATRPDRRRFTRGGRRKTDRPGRHPIVLIADSYAGARVPCARYLDRFGFHVLEAADGEQALSAINETPPHLIIMELGLPVMSAGRLSRWLAQNWRTRHIPVIVLTGDPTPGLEEEPPVTAAGMLVKPFQLPQMLDEIRRVIRTYGYGV